MLESNITNFIIGGEIMKKGLISLILVLFFILSMESISLANDIDKSTYSHEKLDKLMEYKYKIHELNDLEQSGLITKSQAKERIENYLSNAQKIAGNDLTLNNLLLLELSDSPIKELTPLQKFAGYITLINIFWLIAICIGVVCLCFLLINWGKWIFKFLKCIPIVIYEFLFYLISLSFITGGYFLNNSINEYISFTGCLILIGALKFTSSVHKLRVNVAKFFSILFIVYVPTTIIIQSEIIGFISIIALMGALGFSTAIGVCEYYLGFEDMSALGRATSIAFLILIAYVAMNAVSQYIYFLKFFEKGALFMGSFIGYLGLLIASCKWYEVKWVNYWCMQAITIFAGISALTLGSILGIGMLSKIGGTFFVLYLIEKPFEIPVQKRTHSALIGLGVSILIYFGCLYAKANPEYVRNYLLYSF